MRSELLITFFGFIFFLIIFFLLGLFCVIDFEISQDFFNKFGVIEVLIGLLFIYLGLLILLYYFLSINDFFITLLLIYLNILSLFLTLLILKFLESFLFLFKRNSQNHLQFFIHEVSIVLWHTCLNISHQRRFFNKIPQQNATVRIVDEIAFIFNVHNLMHLL